MLELFGLPGIVLPGKRRLRRVFALYVERNVPFIDAYHAVLMADLGLTQVVSFDRHYDRIPGLRRVEP